MAVDKLVDSTQLNSDLTSIANAIRTKGGTSASLAFPADFITAINNIQTGSLVVTDTTDPAGGTVRTATAQSTVTLQGTKTVTPTSSAQTVLPDTGYDGFSQVTVEAASGGASFAGTITINNYYPGNCSVYYIDNNCEFVSSSIARNGTLQIPAALYGTNVATLVMFYDQHQELDITGGTMTRLSMAYVEPYMLAWIHTLSNRQTGIVNIYELQT